MKVIQVLCRRTKRTSLPGTSVNGSPWFVTTTERSGGTTPEDTAGVSMSTKKSLFVVHVCFNTYHTFETRAHPHLVHLHICPKRLPYLLVAKVYLYNKYNNNNHHNIITSLVKQFSKQTLKPRTYYHSFQRHPICLKKFLPVQMNLFKIM